MRFIKKNRVSALFCILGCVLLSGCKKQIYVNVNDDTVIKKITVNYDDDNGERKKVAVNLFENTKTSLLFQDEVIEIIEDFEVDDSFSDFIKKTILTDTTVKTENSIKKSDEQRILWKITIMTNDDYYNLIGFDEYPSYWDELLEYMGVKIQ